jgi:hypothetical protein
MAIHNLRIGAVVLFALVTSGAYAQQPTNRGTKNSNQADASTSERISLSIDNEGRPLAGMTRKVMEKYGVPVCYEDLKWADRSDMQPVGQNPKNQGRILNQDLLVPGPASLTIELDRDSRTKKPLSPLDTVLQSAINEHFARHNPGEFRLIMMPDELCYVVAPSRGKDKNGAMVAAKSPLDVSISFPALERTDDELLNTIIEAVIKATGEDIAIYFNKGPRKSANPMSADKEVARDVLAKALRQLYPWKSYWRLYNTPGDDNWGLNIGSVSQEIMDLSGETLLAPVYWPIQR